MDEDQEHRPLVDLSEMPPLSDFGPKMQALTERQRKFVWCYLKNEGNPRRAYIEAGYASPNQNTIGVGVHRLMHTQAVLEAIRECAWMALHSLTPAAINAYKHILADPRHKEYRRAAADILDRTGFAPVTRSEHTVTVEHHDAEARPLSSSALRELQHLAEAAGLDSTTLRRIAPPRENVVDAEVIAPVPDDDPDNPANW